MVGEPTEHGAASDRLPGRTAADAAQSRAASRLEERARELDLIQALGRRAAEAQVPEQLFSATISVLSHSEPIDLAMVVGEVDGAREAIAFVARPFDDTCLRAVAQRGGEFLGWPSAARDTAPIVTRRLDDFESGRGVRGDFQPGDLVLLPLLRRGRSVACLLFLPSGRAERGRLRLLYSAANQLSLHLDRILTGREAEADRFRTILDSMPQAVLLADERMQLVQCNRAGLHLLGRMNLPIGPDLTPIVGALGLEALVAGVRGGESELADGEASVDDLTLSVTVSPLANGSRDSGGVVLVLSDVTDSRRMQERLAQSEKMSSLGQLISGTAHELNNPLASVLGYAQLLRGAANDDAEMTRRLEVLQREAQRCQKIVGNLLAFARRRDPEWKPISLNEVIESVLSLMSYQLRVDGVGVSAELSPQLPALEGDAHQLQQVFINLLTNARDAIRQSGAEGRVSLATAVDGDAVVVEVRDSGPGIPENVRSRIFDPFFTTKGEGKGTGLGLSIVYGIVTAHGGTIEVVPGDGGRFRLRLPVRPAAVAGDGEALAPADGEPLRHIGRVLVVEDEEILGAMICEALGEDGHLAELVNSGSAALQRALSQPFDLIVADMKMPGMTADLLVDELRRRCPELDGRVIVMTGDTVSGEPDRFAADNELELLRKPFDLRHLCQRVRRRLAASEGH